jgi:hypothetical protein
MKPEAVGLMVIGAGAVFLLLKVIKWFCTGKPGPEVWNEETEHRLHQPDATPLCTRCLEPQETDELFCHNCGMPVDPLVPFSPYLYLFAFGDILAVGTTRRFRVNWLTVTGFVLLPVAFLGVILAPVYWFFFFQNLRRMPGPTHSEGPPPGEARDSTGTPA